jgi:hypothetical protein
MMRLMRDVICLAGAVILVVFGFEVYRQNVDKQPVGGDELKSALSGSECVRYKLSGYSGYQVISKGELTRVVETCEALRVQAAAFSDSE